MPNSARGRVMVRSRRPYVYTDFSLLAHGGGEMRLRLLLGVMILFAAIVYPDRIMQ